MIKNSRKFKKKIKQFEKIQNKSSKKLKKFKKKFKKINHDKEFKKI